eukprot:scaffold127841_cov28-Tisochrysis_lutea.AAC.8
MSASRGRFFLESSRHHDSIPNSAKAPSGCSSSSRAAACSACEQETASPPDVWNAPARSRGPPGSRAICRSSRLVVLRSSHMASSETGSETPLAPPEVECHSADPPGATRTDLRAGSTRPTPASPPPRPQWLLAPLR